MGYMPSKADPNLWMKDCTSHYEYIAYYVDYVLVWSKDAMGVMNQLKETYILKGVGIPEYYLGADVMVLGDEWTHEGVGLAMSAQTYLSMVIPKLESMFDKDFKFKSYKIPMEEDYHPEMDDSPLLDQDGAAKFRSIIGSAQWIITLGRFDIQFAVSSLSRFNMAPRVGHMKAAQRLFGYLKAFPKGKIIYDCSYPDHSKYPVEDHEKWGEFYPNVQEELPPDMPKPRGKSVRITCYVDANHAHDLVNCRSATGILLLVNKAPIRWISKRQKTVETSTYGSELVAARLTAELLMEVRYQLRMLGVPLDGPALLLGDNMSVVLNTSVPSSVLKKKHNAIAYHRVCETIAAKVFRFVHIESTKNPADVLTKPLGHVLEYSLVNPLLFRQPFRVPQKEKVEV